MKSYSLKYSVSLLLLIVVATFFSGCEEKDYYDPNYQTENPMGDISAPDGFSWKTTLSVPVTVKVNDEMLGAYHYMVEVFDDNPLSNPDAGILARGVAKANQDFSTGITVPAEHELVYIRQTDPKGRVRIQAASTASDIACTFLPDYISEPGTRAVATRAVVEIPSYTIEDAEGATEWSGGSFNSNTKYIVSAGQSITTNKLEIGGAEGSQLFIAGNWTVNNTITIGSGVEFIILDGGSVTFTEFASSNGNGNVVIMPGGTMNINGSKGAMIGASNSFYCLGTMNVSNSTLDAQNGDGSIFYIGPEGIINAKDIKIHNDKTYIENHGQILVKTWSKGGGAATVYNMCLIQAETSIDFTDIGGLFMDGGIVIAPQVIAKTTPIELRNGAMLKCDKFTTEGTCTITGHEVGNRSLVKTQTIAKSGSGSLYVSGHVTLENNSSAISVNTRNGADMAPYDNASIVIEGCKSKGNPGDEGEEPEEPEFPIVTPVTGKYTYLFEDNWPLYGDYDMNDAVFKIDNIKTTLSAQNLAQKYTFDITCLAAGAQKRIAGALMLDMVSASNISSVSYSTSAPESFNVNSFDVEQGQTKAVIPLFDNIHALLGNPSAWYINTLPNNKDNTDPVKITVEISFSTPVLAIDLNVNYLNFFIIADIDRFPVESEKRREIHQVGFAPTALADTSLFGNHNDGSSGSKYYLSKDNLAWGIVVPDEFKWMIEQKDIQDGYLDFKAWVTSGGTSNATWWKGNVDAGKIYNP